MSARLSNAARWLIFVVVLVASVGLWLALPQRVYEVVAEAFVLVPTLYLASVVVAFVMLFREHRTINPEGAHDD